MLNLEFIALDAEENPICDDGGANKSNLIKIEPCEKFIPLPKYQYTKNSFLCKVDNETLDPYLTEYMDSISRIGGEILRSRVHIVPKD